MRHETSRWCLELRSLDDDDAVHFFEYREMAIDFAVVWFVSGYDPENGGLDEIPPGVAKDTARLIADLSEGREFICTRFCERATLTEVTP